MRALLVALLGLSIVGCSASRDFLKQIDNKSYDGAAFGASEYCKRAQSGSIRAVRKTARREIRQRGRFGPPAPLAIPDTEIDVKTAVGDGPVVRIWCEGEEVPVEVWKDLVKQ